MTDHQIPIEITEAAGEWLDRLSASELNRDERAAFIEWLRLSPQHVAEFLNVSRIQSLARRQFDGDPAWSASLLPTWVPEDVVVPIAEASSIPAARTPTLATKAWPLRAASFAAVVGLFVVGWWSLSSEPVERYETQLGEQRALLLDDGSTVQLNTDTKLIIRMTDELRQIELVHGEVLVEVEHETARPFLVRVDDVQVKALGTLFAVHRLLQSVEVTVVEGRVDVRTITSESQTGDSASESTLELSAGYRTYVAQHEALPEAKKVNVDRELAWTQRRLNFERATVAEVAQEFNRYNRMQLILGDAGLADRTISGVFNVNDLDAFITMLDSLDAIEVSDTKDGNRILRAKN